MDSFYCDGCCKLCEDKCKTPVCLSPCAKQCVHSKNNYIVERYRTKDGKAKIKYDFTPLLGVKNIRDLR